MEIYSQLLQNSHFDWLPPHHVRQSLRAKRLQIQVSHRKGLEIILPRRVRINDVATFIQRKRNWIEKQYRLLSSLCREPSTEISLCAIGETYTLDFLGTMNKHAWIKFLKKKAQAVFPAWLERVSLETGLTYHKLRIKNQKTLWGSCSVNKTINLSQSLLFLPPHLVNYVLIHELCHTVHLNHSIRFWKLVSQFDANYKQHAKETRKGRHYIPTFLL